VRYPRLGAAARLEVVRVRGADLGELVELVDLAQAFDLAELAAVPHWIRRVLVAVLRLGDLDAALAADQLEVVFITLVCS